MDKEYTAEKELETQDSFEADYAASRSLGRHRPQDRRRLRASRTTSGTVEATMRLSAMMMEDEDKLLLIYKSGTCA
jgi:hypothetical protein